MESLGEAIKAGRLKKNMTQQELAEDICTQATISNIEKAGKVPAITLLLAIADRLDIDIDELYYLMGENITKNSKIMKKVKLLCSQSNHKEASDLLKEFNESDLQSIKEKYEERIRNTFQSKRSNGPLEGSINKIKVIKRTAYGYTSFLNYKYRILISFQEK